MLGYDLDRLGGTMIPGLIPRDVALEWADRAAANVASRVDRDSAEPRNLDEGGAYHHAIADAHRTRQILPEVFGLYAALPVLLTELTGTEVICSPYPASAVTLKVYEQAGDQQGWHYDTNPLTALLILTDTDCGYGTEVRLRDGRTYNLTNKAGDLWVMHGRTIRHRVPPLPAGALRVTVPLNYYYPHDTWRPEGMDDLVYAS